MKISYKDLVASPCYLNLHDTTNSTNLIVAKEQEVIRLWLHGALIFHSPLENKWWLELKNITDSKDVIITKEKGRHHKVMNVGCCVYLHPNYLSS